MRIDSIATTCTAVRFADTNVLLYLVSTDQAEDEKRTRARQILDEGNLVLSTQVLQEFYVQATRSTRPDPLSHDQARRLVESFTRYPLIETTSDLVLAASLTCERFQISFWDAAIIEAARTADASVVLSEDLSDGQDYDGVRVENPFRGG